MSEIDDALLRARAEAAEADRDRLAKLVAEMREQIDMLRLSQSLDKDSAYVIRRTLAEAGVPAATFVDDHVRNAIAQRDRLSKAVMELLTALKLVTDELDPPGPLRAEIDALLQRTQEQS